MLALTFQHPFWASAPRDTAFFISGHVQLAQAAVAAVSQQSWLTAVQEAGLQAPSQCQFHSPSLWLPRYPHYQLVNLAVSELVTIRCAVVAVPLGPDAWPPPRISLLGSWALCWTLERSCRWCWAQGSRRQWCRMSRTRLQKWIICSCSFTDCEAELGLDPEGKPHCHCLLPSCILPDVSLKFLID